MATNTEDHLNPKDKQNLSPRNTNSGSESDKILKLQIRKTDTIDSSSPTSAAIQDVTEASPLTDKNNDQRDLESATTTNTTSTTNKKLSRGSFSLLERLRQQKRSRVLYLTTLSLCVVLFIIILFLIAFWPHVPFFMKLDTCVEKECMIASQQLLLWANTSSHPCKDTYNWACGNFKKEYDNGEFFSINKGEWDVKTHYEYEELRELNIFISMLPTSGVSYSVDTLISNLYKSCREESLDKSQSDLLLRKAINTLGGWQMISDGTNLQFWDYRKALLHLQTLYGVFPFYKISVENRLTKPFDYIITIDEGEIGLPDKYFYNIETNNEIITAYNMLLRDFAINIGVVHQKADSFADGIFHYEQRIVNRILPHCNSHGVKTNQIKTIEEIQKIAPSLPIFESIKAIFPHYKITEETEILVRNVEVLREMSIVVSTSDKRPLNDFIVWSLARSRVQYLSREYRILVEKFQQSLYGLTNSTPRWLTCTKIVQSWLPFGVDALQQNPSLVKSSPGTNNKMLYPKLLSNGQESEKIKGNDELIQLIFYSIQNQIQDTIQKSLISPSILNYILEKLSVIRLQIGIPEDLLETKSYLNKYYEQFILQNLYFVEHVDSLWSFRKIQMSEKLNPQGIDDTIISDFYSKPGFEAITYSKTLNMVLISKRLYQSNYFNYKFPISVNFARVGVDIAKVLLKVVDVMAQQYAEELYFESNSTAGFINILQLSQYCINEDVNQENILPNDVLENLHVSLSSTKVAARALSTFIRAVDSGQPINGAKLNSVAVYESLRLSNRKRLAGLRIYNDNELFTLAELQTHCNTPISDEETYNRIKPHIERTLTESQLFKIVWENIEFLKISMDCSANDPKCTNIL